MQHSDDARCASIVDGSARIFLCISRVNDQRFAELRGKSHLRRENGALCLAGRIVVVVVEAALAHGDGGALEQLAQAGQVPLRVERSRVVRMDSGGRENQARVVRGNLRRDRSGAKRFTNADDCPRARRTGARDYRVAVAGERCVREVGVAVDEG